jgi:hypothetical protein
MKSRLLHRYLSLSVVLASRRLFFFDAPLTSYESCRIYRGPGVDQLQPVAGDLAGVPTKPYHNILNCQAEEELQVLIIKKRKLLYILGLLQPLRLL